MATNNMLPFCPTDTGTNLLTQGDYSVATDRTNGNQPGVASSKLVNKALRQSSIMASQLAQALSDLTGADMLDNGQSDPILGVINAMLTPLSPIVQTFTSSGTYNQSYIFFISTGSADAGATYTNNGVTYTVLETIASGTILKARGNNVPEFSGTLTKASGTGDAALTFYAFRKPTFVNVTVVGAGGAGGGAVSTGASQASTGAGGSSGGMAKKKISSSALGVTETVTIGSGGTGSAGSVGGAGGSSSFGSHCSASGGSGGNSSGATTGTTFAASGGAGSGSGGDVNVTGNNGGYALAVGGAPYRQGFGAPSPLGGGMLQVPAPGSQGTANTVPGSGGTGTDLTASATQRTGGAGAPGIVYVEECYQ